MWSCSSTAIIATGRLSSRFSWLPSLMDVRTSRSDHAWVSTVFMVPCPGMPRSAIVWRPRLVWLLYGLKISDLGPFRAARADVLRRLELQETTYGWAVEIILKGALAGFRIVEVPVSYHPRIGKSKISGTLKGTVGAAWFILSRIVSYYFRHRRTGMPRPA